MIITFCGHSDYVPNSSDEQIVMEILDNRVKDTCNEFFLGEYGGFDSFAYRCAKKFKQCYSNSKLVFITPYISSEYQSKYIKEYGKDRFDLVIYPELEKIPPKFAILYRNRWMIDQADIVISYISRQYGGAYKMYEYARRKNKELYNIVTYGEGRVK
jgi:uncharacterized phage-like protein YoqJ